MARGCTALPRAIELTLLPAFFRGRLFLRTALATHTTRLFLRHLQHSFETALAVDGSLVDSPGDHKQCRGERRVVVDEPTPVIDPIND